MKTIKNLFAAVLLMFAFASANLNAANYSWLGYAVGTLDYNSTNAWYVLYDGESTIEPDITDVFGVAWSQCGTVHLNPDGCFWGTYITSTASIDGYLAIYWAVEPTGTVTINNVEYTTYSGFWSVLYGEGDFWDATGSGDIEDGLALMYGAVPEQGIPPYLVSHTHTITGTITY
jgi:hypothetical protein